LGYTDEIVELDCGHTLVDTGYDLLSDSRGIYVLWIEAITQSGDTCCDLVELYAFFASICRNGQWLLNEGFD
jgi:hypothetical protein